MELEEIKGNKIGIDAMGWLYQAYFGTPDDEAESKLSIRYVVIC